MAFVPDEGDVDLERVADQLEASSGGGFGRLPCPTCDEVVDLIWSVAHGPNRVLTCWSGHRFLPDGRVFDPEANASTDRPPAADEFGPPAPSGAP